MSYQEFINEVIKRLKETLPTDTDLRVQTITKNNNLKLDGLLIMNAESNISPTYYLNYYYEDFTEHGDMEKIINFILSSYEEQPRKQSVDISFFTDFKNIKDKIVYKIINFSKNKEQLKDIPHIPYLDLAIVFYCMINHEQFQNATILIHNQHLDLWHISDRELYQIAIENTPKLLPYHFLHMNELLHDVNLLSEENAPSMYVLSNQSKLFGAACILYLNLLDEISERLNSSFYVLPSSVHEVILVPDINSAQLNYYSQMVREVNMGHVVDEEILSDHAYYYNKDEKALMYY